MKLLNKYEKIGIIKAGELLLLPQDAVKLAEDLEQKGILILGVNVWYHKNNKLVEDPNSLDMSEILDAKESIEIAKKFIKAQLPQKTAYVSFVLEED